MYNYDAAISFTINSKVVVPVALVAITFIVYTIPIPAQSTVKVFPDTDASGKLYSISEIFTSIVVEFNKVTGAGFEPG